MNPITLAVAELKPALIGLGKIIRRRTTLHVLSHVLVERNYAGWITLAATDLDAWASVRMEKPGKGGSASLLVPLADLQKTVKNCNPGDQITIEESGDQVTLRYPIGSQYARWTVNSLPSADFPPQPPIDGTPVRLSSDVRSSLLQAMECASTDKTRAILNGAYLDASRISGHYVIGTDGHRLYCSNSFWIPLKTSTIVPAHRFLAWKPFAADGEWLLTVSRLTSETRYLRIDSSRWSLTCRTVEGAYCDWRSILTAGDSATTIEFEQGTEQLIRTVERMPHDESFEIVGLEVSGRKLRLIGKTKEDKNWSRIDVEARVIGKPVTTYLKRSYLTKALQFGLSQIEIFDPPTPLRFSQGGRQMLVMPARVVG